MLISITCRKPISFWGAFEGSMYAIAKDVKIQIEFNPELGSRHTVTTLYEVIPAGVNSMFAPKETKLKYFSASGLQNFGDELATIKFRYKKPAGDTSLEMT